MRMAARRCWRCGLAVRAKNLNGWRCSVCGTERAIHGFDADFASVEGVNEGKVGSGVSDVWESPGFPLQECDRGLLMVFEEDPG